MALSKYSLPRSEWLNLRSAPVVAPTAGISIEDTGVGPVRQVVVTMKDVVFTLTDRGSVGSGSLKLFTMPKGNIHLLGGSGKLTYRYGSVTDANLISSVGTAQVNNDDDLGDTGEADIIPSTATPASAGAATFTAKSTTTGSVVDGTGTPVAVYLNMATSSDPSTNNTIIVNGKLVVTYINHGDAATIA